MVIASLFFESAGRIDMRGKSWFYSCAVSLLAIFEFDDGYAFYCVMLLYKRGGQCIFFQQLSKYINPSPSASPGGKL